MGQRKRLGGASEKLFELEVEAEIAMVDGQLPRGRSGERLGRTRQAAEYSGGALGEEGRVAGEQLVGAVTAQNDFHLFRAKRLRRWVGRIDASPKGSSSQLATLGSN